MCSDSHTVCSDCHTDPDTDPDTDPRGNLSSLQQSVVLQQQFVVEVVFVRTAG